MFDCIEYGTIALQDIIYLLTLSAARSAKNCWEEIFMPKSQLGGILYIFPPGLKIKYFISQGNSLCDKKSESIAPLHDTISHMQCIFTLQDTISHLKQENLHAILYHKARVTLSDTISECNARYRIITWLHSSSD